jgi:excisionase family DNA binding protein
MTKKPAVVPTILVSLQKAESIFGVPATTLRDMIAHGSLASVRFEGNKRIWLKRADVEALIERSTEQVAR